MSCRKPSCKQAIDRTVERFGRLDILVNNAGTNVRKQPQNLIAEDWHLVMNTNLTAAFLCSQAAYSHMVRAGGGKIINIGSMMSIFGASFATPYAASKGGIVQMTRALATAWAKDSIQVNAILPGSIPSSRERPARKFLASTREYWRRSLDFIDRRRISPASADAGGRATTSRKMILIGSTFSGFHFRHLACTLLQILNAQMICHMRHGLSSTIHALQPNCFARPEESHPSQSAGIRITLSKLRRSPRELH